MAQRITFGELRRIDTSITLADVPEDYPDTPLQLDLFKCPNIYYRLQDNNGGKNPRAADPGTRWGRSNLTSDCMGGYAWGSGFDRYQPKRFTYQYGGWINTNSMYNDAVGKQECFEALERPEPGCGLVFKTQGDIMGHVAGVIEVPAEWQADRVECWEALILADIAGKRPLGANRIRPNGGRAWFGKDHVAFVRSKMVA